MEYRKLHLHSSNEVFVSRLCFGSEPLGGADWGLVDIQKIKLALIKSYELGWNFIDTAAIYGLGMSEINIAEVINASGINFLVSTKIGVSILDIPGLNGNRANILRTLNPNILESEFHASLKRLNCSYLPLVYLHYPDLKQEPSNVTKMISSLIEKKVLGGYGVSNFSLDQIKQYHNLLPISAVQFECSMLDVEKSDELKQIVEWCKENKILTVAYGVLKKGLLTGKFGLHSPKFHTNDRRARLATFSGNEYYRNIKKIIEIINHISPTGRSLSEIAIRYVLDAFNIDVAIVGIKNEEQLVVNNKASCFKLNELEILQLNKFLY